MHFPWKTVAAIAAVFFVSLIFLSRIYAYLSVAFILAYLLEPVVSRLAKRKVPRQLAALLTLAVFFLLISLAGVLIIPRIIDQGQELLERLPTAYAKLTVLLAPYSERYLGYDIFSDFRHALSNLGSRSEIMKPIGGIVQGVFSTTLKFVTTILGLLIIPLLAFYLLREFPALYKRTVIHALPARLHGVAEEIRRRLNRVLGGFIRGQLVVSGILSVYYGVSLSIAGVELSLALGIMAGFLNIVPYLGIFSVFILTLLVALLHGAGMGLILAILVIFAVGMMLEGAVITPRVLGNEIGLSPLTLILALLVGGELFGIVGMVVGVPVAAVVKVFWEMALEHRI